MCLLIIWYQKWKKQFILELIVKDINFVLKVTLHPKKNQNSLFTNYNILFFLNDRLQRRMDTKEVPGLQ